MVTVPSRLSPPRAVLLALALGACGLAPAPSPEAPFPGDGGAGFGEASPVDLCLGTADVVSPDLSAGAAAVCVPSGAPSDACSDSSPCSGIEQCICGRCIVVGCTDGSSCADGQVCSGQRCTT